MSTVQSVLLGEVPVFPDALDSVLGVKDGVLRFGAPGSSEVPAHQHLNDVDIGGPYALQNHTHFGGECSRVVATWQGGASAPVNLPFREILSWSVLRVDSGGVEKYELFANSVLVHSSTGLVFDVSKNGDDYFLVMSQTMNGAVVAYLYMPSALLNVTGYTYYFQALGVKP